MAATGRLTMIAAALLAMATPAAAGPAKTGLDDPVAAAQALRVRADRTAEEGGDVAALEAAIPADAQGDAWTDARAWILHRQGRHAEAAALLEPLARPRHHTLPRWPLVHAHLGEVYAAMGRPAAAEGQWRVALASDGGPEGSGWDPAAVEARLARVAAAAAGAAPVVPVTIYPDAVYMIDLASIRRTDAGVRYEKVELLLNDEDGAAFSRFAREIDCGGEARARVEWRRRYGADGTPVETPAIPDDWQPIRHDDPWLHTERRLVCELPEGTPFRASEAGDLERLQAFRRSAA